MKDLLFSDIPVSGGNFQGRVDQMCEVINKVNELEKTEEVPGPAPKVEEPVKVEEEVKPVLDDTLSKLTS